MPSSSESPRLYNVMPHRRKPLIRFALDALEASGCRILHEPPADRAPFRITFETPGGERMGIIMYAFLANHRVIKNRPKDEHRFQVKYGAHDTELHELWQDPFGLYVTLLVGINPELGIFVGADPVLRSPTRIYASVEFKDAHVEEIQRLGWYAWARKNRPKKEVDVGLTETLVGGTAASFLRYVRFEREVLGESPGHRQLVAERMPESGLSYALPEGTASGAPSPARLHQLAQEFQLDEDEVLDLIATTRRLKMAVRGWVAEEHLVRALRTVPGVSECERIDEEGGPDVRLRFDGRTIRVECKNVLRQRTADGLARVDFQRTRASQGDPCSRFYSPADFDVVAACLHAVSERWEFRFVRSDHLDPHKKCAGKLSNLAKLDDRWTPTAEEVFRSVAAAG